MPRLWQERRSHYSVIRPEVGDNGPEVGDWLDFPPNLAQIIEINQVHPALKRWVCKCVDSCAGIITVTVDEMKLISSSGKEAYSLRIWLGETLRMF